MSNNSALFAAAAFIALLAPSTGSATTIAATQPDAPVAIEACAVGHPAAGLTSIGQVALSDGLRITFVNHSNQPVANAEFAVRYAGQTEKIVDAGPFAPGAQVTHYFDVLQNLPYSDDSAQCAVQAVTFGDGTAWRAADGF